MIKNQFRCVCCKALVPSTKRFCARCDGNHPGAQACPAKVQHQDCMGERLPGFERDSD